MLCLNEYYLSHEGTGKQVLVGYRIRDLKHLEELSYRVSRSAVEDFLKARRRGVVYINREQYEAAEESALLFNKKGMMIAVAYRKLK